MDSEFPCVSVGLNHLGLSGKVSISAVRHVAIADPRLEIAPILDPVWRVHEDALDLTSKTFASRRLIMIISESPRIMRFDQLRSCW